MFRAGELAKVVCTGEVSASIVDKFNLEEFNASFEVLFRSRYRIMADFDGELFVICCCLTRSKHCRFGLTLSSNAGGATCAGAAVDFDLDTK